VQPSSSKFSFSYCLTQTLKSYSYGDKVIREDATYSLFIIKSGDQILLIALSKFFCDGLGLRIQLRLYKIIQSYYVLTLKVMFL
jgi:hypothetical protein